MSAKDTRTLKKSTRNAINGIMRTPPYSVFTNEDMLMYVGMKLKALASTRRLKKTIVYCLTDILYVYDEYKSSPIWFSVLHTFNLITYVDNYYPQYSKILSTMLLLR